MKIGTEVRSPKVYKSDQERFSWQAGPITICKKVPGLFLSCRDLQLPFISNQIFHIKEKYKHNKKGKPKRNNSKRNYHWWLREQWIGKQKFRGNTAYLYWAAQITFKIISECLVGHLYIFTVFKISKLNQQVFLGSCLWIWGTFFL